MKYISLFLSFYVLLACKPSVDVSHNEQMEKSEVLVQESPASEPNDQTNPSQIDVATAKKMLSQKKEIILIDVRTKAEVDNGKISNALHIDISQPDFENKISALDKNKEYIVYCAVGGRSSTAVNKMQLMGFKKAYNMMGGYTQWVKQ